MKTKSLCLTVLFCVAIPFLIKLNAQTSKGTWLIEANLGDLRISNNQFETKSQTNTSKYEYNTTNVSLYPSLAYFLNENWSLGASLNMILGQAHYTSYWDNGKTSYDAINKSGQLGLRPFIRYYFTKNSKDRFYAQAGGGINFNLFSSFETNYYTYDGLDDGNNSGSSDGHSLNGEFLIGFNHFFTETVAFNSAIGYNYSVENRTTSSIYTSSGNPSSTQNVENTNTVGMLTWHFGFSIFLRCKATK